MSVWNYLDQETSFPNDPSGKHRTVWTHAMEVGEGVLVRTIYESETHSPVTQTAFVPDAYIHQREIRSRYSRKS